jgi:hypothetical protein
MALRISGLATLQLKCNVLHIALYFSPAFVIVSDRRRLLQIFETPAKSVFTPLREVFRQFHLPILITRDGMGTGPVDACPSSHSRYVGEHAVAKLFSRHTSGASPT